MKLGLWYKRGKRPTIRSNCLVFLLLAVSFCCFFSSMALAEEAVTPEQIILTWTADPATSQTITWLAPDDAPSYVQYIREAEYYDSFDSALQIDAGGTLFDSVNYRYTANLSGLTPDTNYVYRVGNEGNWSEAQSFSTAENTQNVTFMYMGDVQSGYDEWGNVLSSVYQEYPQIKFTLLGGDLTDNGSDETEWGQFLDAAASTFSRIPVMPTIGNHDGVMYSNFFALPDNGPEDLEQECYSFDYGNAHFVVLNSNKNAVASAIQWLQDDLQNTTKRWKFAMFHHPAYPAFEDYKTIDESICTNWVPILEQNGVDMVFVGHQHEYMRTYPLYQGEIRTDPAVYGIVYVMGNAGSKIYGGGSGFSYIAREESGSNYQVLDINGNVLTMTSRKTTGELIETYTINKSLLTASTLTPDVTRNGVGKEIDLSFEDDPDWRAAITDITVNGSSIAGRYRVTSGNVNIDADVFNDLGEYVILVNACGYSDASVTQFIIEDDSDWYDGYISTVIGNGTRGYSGDGGPATEAQLRSAYDVAMDSGGNIFIADSANYRVRMVAASSGTHYGIPMTAGNIYTVAGNGTNDYSGDGGPATEAQIKSVYGLAVDSAGNIYINDRSDYRIRKVDPSGIITTVAGDGTSGYSGDGGPATGAQLNRGYGLAVDEAGNLYLADGSNYCVRMVAASSGTYYGIAVTAGNIYTIVGNGTSGYSGDGGPAVSAQIETTYDVAIDNSNNLYIADLSRIRKVDPSGIISTVAGSGSSGYSGDGGPAMCAELRSYSLAVDSNYNLYIADKNYYCIRMVDGNGIIATVAGGNGRGYSGDGDLATNAKLQPYGLAIDSAGGLYIADQSGYSVRYLQSPAAAPLLVSLSLSGSPGLTYSGTPLTYDLGGLTLAGVDQDGAAYDLSDKTVTWTVKSGPAELSDTTLSIVRGGTVEISAQVLGVITDFNFTVDTGDLPVIELTVGDINTIAGIGIKGYAGDGGPAINGQLNSPGDVAIDSAGNIFIADEGNNRIRAVAANTGTQYGIDMTAGNIYTVAGIGTRGYSGDGGPAVSAELGQIEALAIDSTGNIYIVDVINNCLRKIDINGIISTVTSINSARGLAIDGSGNIYMGGAPNTGICMLAAETGMKHGISMTAGNVYTVAGNGTGGYSGDGGPATSAKIYGDGIIAVDCSGNLYISDTYNYRVRKVDPSGIITTVAGNGSQGYSGDNGQATDAEIYPIGIAADSAGNLFISGNRCVRKVDVSGIITTVAGDGTSGYSGDGGPATSAQMKSPWGLEVDDAGDLYITDINNNCVRYVKLVPDEDPGLVSLTLSGSPDLNYNGTSIEYDLSGLSLTGTGDSEEIIDLEGLTVTWAVCSGPATVSGNILTITGSGSINVSASIYDVISNVLSLTVNDIGADPPSLTADPGDKIIGEDDVEITFTEDSAWREAINTVIIDDTVLGDGDYSADSAGKIIINGDVFQKAGDYVVVIKATGYSDVSVVQTLVSSEIVLEITGDGVNNHLSYTLAQLQAMEQYRHLYSTINKWPSKKWYVGEGVKVKDLLTQAGMKENATLIKFTARDGYAITFTVQELLDDKRYLFPNFKEPGDGHIPGSAADAEEVETILALNSDSSNDFDTMNDHNALHLIIGQRAVGEQLNDAYVKYVNKIEVFTTALSKWESPQAVPDSGNVAVGTLVTLSTSDMNWDKIYYTLDGSTPTMNSTMYNPIGKEWWSSRQDVLNTINHPIEIQNNTTIKAIAIGPGKENSDIAIFTYQIDSGTNPPALTADTTGNEIGQMVEITFTDDADWRGAITGIEVNGSDLSSEQYTVSEGNINIIADVFTAAGDYTIVVTATGYEDASVTQTMDASAGVVFTVDGEVSQTYTMADLKAMTATTGTYGSKTCTGVALNDLLTGLGITDGNWTVTVNAADGWETDPIPVSDIQEPTNNYLLTYAIDGSDIVVDGDSNLTPLRLYYGTAGNSVYKHVESITVSEPAGCEAVYTVTPVSDSAYTAGTTPSGIDTMTVNSGMTGFKYFAVNITPVIEHSGNEAVVFTLLRDSIQISINVTKADFDLVTTAQAGFNVQAGDVIKAYIVDDLTNAVDCNPVILQ